MKKNKGFTLIELLAVIVILAIIAVIATPIILGVIDDAKKSAANDSAYGALDALSKYYAISQITTDAKNLPLVVTFNNETGYAAAATGTDTVITGDDLQMSGTRPTEGVIRLNISGAYETPVNLKVNGYTCTYADKKFDCR